jgi:hypothetical protein
MRGIVGEDRRGKKQMDVPLHYPSFKVRRHNTQRLPGGCQEVARSTLVKGIESKMAADTP